MKKNSIALNVLLGLLFLLPIFFIPSVVVPLPVAKIAVIAIGAILAFLAFISTVLKEGKVSYPGSWLLGAVLLVPLVYLISAVASTSSAASLFGGAMAAGTFGFMLVAAVLLGLAAVLPQTREDIFKSYSALLFSFGLLAIYAVVKILSSGKALVWNNFTGVLSTPAGDWTDVGIIFGLVSIVCLFALELLPVKRFLKWALYALLAVSVAVLVFSNFSVAWILVLVFSLVAFVYFMVTERSEAEGSHTRKISKLSLALFVISLIFVINPTISPTKGNLGSTIASVFKIQNVDIRPTLASTAKVTSSVLKTNALLGSGPNTFDRDWLLHKPAGVNSTNFWSVAFSYGFGFLPTQVASVGLLGTVLWLAFLFLLAWLGVKALFRPELSKSDRFLAMSTSLGAIFLWVAAILYAPGIAVLALSFIFTGLFLSVAAQTGIIQLKTTVFSTSTAKNFLAIFLLVAFGIGTVAFGFLSYEKIASVVYYNKAVTMIQSNASLASVEAELSKAANLSPEDAYYRALADVNFTQAQQALNDSSKPANEAKAAFQTAISKSISAAQAATKVEPGNYLNWMKLGAVYEALVPAPLAIQGAYDSSKSAYEQAAKLSPQSPDIPLIMARLEIENKNLSGAHPYIEKSLALKQDYADAYYLETQLDITENNLPQAIKAAETAALLTPDNAGIFFEVGLLKYNANDYAGARDALAQALQIMPNYANAQYFLALSLDKLGDKANAITLMQQLSATNPDNTELPVIISNLQAGKDALFKIAPATSTSTAPISEKKQ